MEDLHHSGHANVERGGLLDRHRGEMGATQVLRPGERKALLQLAAENPANPTVVTVGFSVTEIADPSGDAAVDGRLHAHLSWATGRGEAHAVVDLRNGGHVTLAANVLNVTARYTGSVGAAFKVSSFAAYGPRRGARHPAVTHTGALVVPGDTHAIQPGQMIPAFAVAVAWCSPGDALEAPPPAATLRMVTDRRKSAAVVAQASPPPLTFVPIPNGAHYVALRNDGAPGASYALVYELSL